MKKLLLLCFFSCFCLAEPKILFFGDSNTLGTKADLNSTHAENKTFAGIVKNALKGKASVEINAKNGRTIALDVPNAEYNGIRALRAHLKENKSDIAVIMLGTNDLALGAAPQPMIAYFSTLLSDLKKAGCRKIIVIAPPLLEPSYLVEHDKKAISTNSKVFNGELQKLAYQRNAKFLNAAKIIEKAHEMDEVHMSEDDHKSLAAAILPLINELFGE